MSSGKGTSYERTKDSLARKKDAYITNFHPSSKRIEILCFLSAFNCPPGISKSHASVKWLLVENRNEAQLDLEAEKEKDDFFTSDSQAFTANENSDYSIHSCSGHWPNISVASQHQD